MRGDGAHAFGAAVDVQAGGADLASRTTPTRRRWPRRSPASRRSPGPGYAGVVRVAGAKMAKSAGNLVLVEELLADYPAAAVRLLILDRRWHEDWDYAARAGRGRRPAGSDRRGGGPSRTGPGGSRRRGRHRGAGRPRRRPRRPHGLAHRRNRRWPRRPFPRLPPRPLVTAPPRPGPPPRPPPRPGLGPAPACPAPAPSAAPGLYGQRNWEHMPQFLCPSHARRGLGGGGAGGREDGQDLGRAGAAHRGSRRSSVPRASGSPGRSSRSP